MLPVMLRALMGLRPKAKAISARGRYTHPASWPLHEEMYHEYFMQTHAIGVSRGSVILVIVVLLFGNAPAARAADPLSATQSPTVAANVGTTGTGWSASTVARALAVDGSETKLTNALPANGTSMLLTLTGFNFDVPADATITGVAVSVTRRSTASSGEFVRDAAIELVGGFGTSTSLASADAWPATHAAASYGGSAELWGANPAPTDVNAANFGLAIAAQNTDPDAAHNAHVDGATITVYYTESDTPPPIDTPPDPPGNIGSTTLVWGNSDGTDPQQITMEDGGTYVVPLNTAAPAYITNTAAGPVIGILFYIDTSGESPVRQSVATMYLHNDSGDESLAWGAAGSYELDILEPPLPQMVNVRMKWIARLLFADIADAMVGAPPSPILETLHFTIQEAPPPCATDCFSNALFLPGIEASRLYRPQVVGADEQRLWEPSFHDNLHDMHLTSQGKSVRDDVYAKTGDVIDETPVGKNIYKSFIAKMGSLKTNGLINDWGATPYDWRLSLDDILASGKQTGTHISYLTATDTPYIIQELKRLAGSSKNGKVTIIAHSNGGLVAKRLTEVLGSDASSLIDKMIFVAVPQVGTPEAVVEGLHGEPIGYGLVASKSAVRTFASTSPMVYHLLPSADYFTQVDDPVITFDSSLADWIAKYGNVIHSEDSLQTFLTDSFGRVDAETGDTNQPIQLSASLFSNAETLHANLDAWTPPAGVELIQIAGWGVPTTVTGITYKKKGDGIAPEPNYTIDGDGTVVVPSALWTSTAEATDYWMNLGQYNKDHRFRTLFGVQIFDHSRILEADPVLSFISDSITDATQPLSTYSYLSTEAPASTGTRLRYALHSPLTLDLYDELGNHTGVSTTTGQIEENIPGTYYVQFGDVKYIFADSGSSQHIVMSGYDTGTFTLEVGEFLGNNETVSTTFADVPVTPQTQVTFTVSSGLTSASNLSVDENGDGTVDSTYASSTGQIIVPVSVDEQDTPPPTGGGASSFLPQTISTTTATTAATSTEVVQVPKQEIAATSTPSISLTQPRKIVQATIKTPIKKKPVVIATSTGNAPTQTSQVASAAQSTGGGLWSRVGHWIMNGIRQFLSHF